MEVAALGMWSVTQDTAECQDLDPVSKQLSVNCPEICDQISHNSCLNSVFYSLFSTLSFLPHSILVSPSSYCLSDSLICGFKVQLFSLTTFQFYYFPHNQVSLHYFLPLTPHFTLHKAGEPCSLLLVPWAGTRSV